jgi:hypothetical protein
MAKMTRVARATLVFGFVLGCGGVGPVASQAPNLTVSAAANTVYGGSPGISVNADFSGGSAEEVSWSLDGPGTLSAASGPITTYTPPTTGDVEARATLTATAGGFRASTTIDVLPPPFTTSPRSLEVTAGDGVTPVLVVPLDPTRRVAWSYSLDGPGAVDDWYAPPEVMYYPPSSVSITTRATIHVLAMDYPYARDVSITIFPRPSPAGFAQQRAAGLVGQPP